MDPQTEKRERDPNRPDRARTPGINDGRGVLAMAEALRQLNYRYPIVQGSFSSATLIGQCTEGRNTPASQSVTYTRGWGKRPERGMPMLSPLFVRKGLSRPIAERILKQVPVGRTCRFGGPDEEQAVLVYLRVREYARRVGVTIGPYQTGNNKFRGMSVVEARIEARLTDDLRIRNRERG